MIAPLKRVENLKSKIRSQKSTSLLTLLFKNSQKMFQENQNRVSRCKYADINHPLCRKSFFFDFQVSFLCALSDRRWHCVSKAPFPFPSLCMSSDPIFILADVRISKQHGPWENRRKFAPRLQEGKNLGDFPGKFIIPYQENDKIFENCYILKKRILAQNLVLWMSFGNLSINFFSYNHEVGFRSRKRSKVPLELSIVVKLYSMKKVDDKWQYFYALQPHSSRIKMKPCFCLEIIFLSMELELLSIHHFSACRWFHKILSLSSFYWLSFASKQVFVSIGIKMILHSSTKTFAIQLSKSTERFVENIKGCYLHIIRKWAPKFDLLKGFTFMSDFKKIQKSYYSNSMILSNITFLSMLCVKHCDEPIWQVCMRYQLLNDLSD